MSTTITVDTNKTEELIVSVPSKEIAEKVRAYLINNHSMGTWIFVYQQIDGKADIKATNEWGARLGQEILTLLQQKAAEIAGVEPPPPSTPVVVPEKTEPTSGSSSAVQEP